MAKKRMFSLSVVDTDNFLDMPVSARLLYYELGMRADDDGFLDNWKKILLFTGLKNDDLKILIAKNFIIPFETGVIVIKHWRMNNYLQNDRYKSTVHQQEYQQLSIKNDNVYDLDKKCIHSIDKNSIDKNSIDKNSNQRLIGGHSADICPPKIELELEKEIDIELELEKEIEDNNKQALPPAVSKSNDKDFIKEFNKLWEYYPNKKGKEQALNKYILARNKGTTYEEVAKGLKNYINYCAKEKLEEKYIKHGSTWFNQKCWNDVYTDSKSNGKKIDNQMEILKGVHNGNVKVS